MLPFRMSNQNMAFPVRVILITPAESEPIIDRIFQDRDSLLDGPVSIVGRESREDTQEIADKLLQGEYIRFDEKILALFPCKA